MNLAKARRDRFCGGQEEEEEVTSFNVEPRWFHTSSAGVTPAPGVEKKEGEMSRTTFRSGFQGDRTASNDSYWRVMAARTCASISRSCGPVGNSNTALRIRPGYSNGDW